MLHDDVLEQVGHVFTFIRGFLEDVQDLFPLQHHERIGLGIEELSDGDDAPPASQGSPSRGRPTPIRGGRQNSTQGSSKSATAEQDTPNGQAEKPASSKRGGAGKARKSQVDLLKTLAVEWRGENGVERLENRLGKPLQDMTRAEADEWIDRLTPEGRE